MFPQTRAAWGRLITAWQDLRAIAAVVKADRAKQDAGTRVIAIMAAKLLEQRKFVGDAVTMKVEESLSVEGETFTLSLTLEGKKADA